MLQPTLHTNLNTTDLSDAHPSDVSVSAPIWQHFGGKRQFSGLIHTVKCFEDNTFVRQTLGTLPAGSVLVVDGGGSTRCALLGDNLAKLAIDQGVQGIIVYGCVRDSAVLATLPLGVMALAAHPRKSIKRNEGQCDIALDFAGITWVPGHMLYADEDGIITSAKAIHDSV